MDDTDCGEGEQSGSDAPRANSEAQDEPGMFTTHHRAFATRTPVSMAAHQPTMKAPNCASGR